MKKLAAFAVLLVMGGMAYAADLTYTNGTAPKSVVNGVVCGAQNFDLDMNANQIDEASVQIVYSSATAPSMTLTDGTAATGTITVASLTGLTTAYATNSIVIASNTAVKNAVLTAAGFPITEGKQWSYDANYSTNSAAHLCAALNTAFSSLFVSTVGSGTSTIYSTAATVGTVGNSISMVSSTQAALTVGSALFTGGNDNAVLSIGGNKITANADYYPITSASTAATKLASAITSKLGDYVKASAAGAVVYTTATYSGKFTNYTMTTSTGALTLSGMSGGIDSDILITPAVNTGRGYGYPLILGRTPALTSTINKVPTGMGTGHAVLFTKVAGTVPTGLTDKTTYYASNLNATSFQLSDTSTGALAGLAISITTTTQAGGGSFTLAPITLTGTPSFALQKSNDGVNFQSVYVTTGAVTTPFIASYSSSATGNVLWDLGKITFRYLRLAISGITWGGMNINEIVNAKKD